MVQEFHVSGSHYEVGLAIGQHFTEQIHKAYDNYAFWKIFFLIIKVL